MHPGCHIDNVYLCREPVDFRKSIGGLSALVEQQLQMSPFDDALFGKRSAIYTVQRPQTPEQVST